ncbi:MULTISPECIES: hypothetical protein [Brevibacterium]|uniref:hypothetical protein n=1 Tax=Brevibacterium TaxID=1696 RepID=UPI001FE71C28|nr:MULTISPECIES: hypothetical protein [Brevibacterium]
MNTTPSRTQAELLERLATRLQESWERDPLAIEPSIRSGLTTNQVTALERASAEAGESGLPHFIAIVPPLPVPARSSEGWSRFTADLAFTMHEKSDSEHTLVVFSGAESAAHTLAYLVDDNGPSIPTGSDQLQRSASGDFLPVELAVPYHLGVLQATAQGTELPSLPDFNPPDVGEEDDDYIEATGLDRGNPDGIVFVATAAATVGLSAWLLRRRSKYSWRAALTTAPELTREHDLVRRAARTLTALPEPATTDDARWSLFDRGRRVQDALTAIIDAHPQWASAPDFSHRHAVHALTRTDAWVRSALRTSSATQRGKAAGEPQFCFFFPSHDLEIEPFAWKQARTTLTVLLCAACRRDLNAGHDPESLMVPRNEGLRKSLPVPYFQRHDAYALSGFGSFANLEDAVAEYGAPGSERR